MNALNIRYMQHLGCKILILTFLEASKPADLIQMFINCFTVQMLCSCSPEDKC